MGIQPRNAPVRPTRTVKRGAPFSTAAAAAAAPTLGLILPLVVASTGCTTAVPRNVRKLDTAELQNIPAVVAAPAAAKAAAATNATPTTRPRSRTKNE
jgi:hypothetical protein